MASFLSLSATYTLGDTELWSSDFPLQLSDGTNLPAPFATEAQLKERIEQKRLYYAPFTRNLTPAADYKRPELILSSQVDWLFREDPEARGEMERWFAVDLSKENWSKQELPDYREFVLGWYRTTFDAPLWTADRIILCFDGVDYGARIYLNERYIG